MHTGGKGRAGCFKDAGQIPDFLRYLSATFSHPSLTRTVLHNPKTHGSANWTSPPGAACRAGWAVSGSSCVAAGLCAGQQPGPGPWGSLQCSSRPRRHLAGPLLCWGRWQQTAGTTLPCQGSALPAQAGELQH